MYFIIVETNADVSHYTVHEKNGVNTNIFFMHNAYSG